MSGTERGPGGSVERRSAVRVRGVEDTGPFPGRHASRTEIAAETPIFHALTASGWRSRQHEQPLAPRRSRESLAAFRQDPLTAPVPVQAYSILAPPTDALPAVAVPTVAPPTDAPPAVAPRAAVHEPRRPSVSGPAIAALATGSHALREDAQDGGRHHRLSVAAGSGYSRHW
ncbi:MAG: hypothetical protein OJJ54_19145 [Pseudonocardia sp.]|nr:hypothetical protein [Pseudonocardia sp.]